MQALHRLPRPFSYLLLSSLVSLALGQQQANIQAPPAEAARTTISATVIGHGLQVVTGLKAEDFTLYEEGRPRPIESVTFGDVPACIGILVDRSGSMRARMRETSDFVMDFVRNSNPENEIFVVNFNDNPFLDQDFTRDQRRIEDALRRAQARGGTALYDAVIAAANHLAKASQCKRRVLLLVSDGEDNESRKTLEQAITAIRSAGNPLVYAIGLPNERVESREHNLRALKMLAIPTGGEVVVADILGFLSQSAHRIAEEIRSQYSISYLSAQSRPAGSPNVKLMVRVAGHKDFDVRVNVPHAD